MVQEVNLYMVELSKVYFHPVVVTFMCGGDGGGKCSVELFKNLI